MGRFISPDTLIPGASNPLSWDRYAYAHNNPSRYNDPTGHCIFGLDTIICIVVAALAVTAVILTGDTDVPPQPGFPQNGIMEGNESINCSASLPDCFGDQVGLKDFSGNGPNKPITFDEFQAFEDKVAEDLSTHNVDWPGFFGGRQAYDTPFYNGGQSERRTSDAGSVEGIYPADQQVCIEVYGCYGRSEINYLAQGMWGAAVGEPKFVSEGITKTWKKVEYGEPPSQGTLFWLNQGYEYYNNWKEDHQK